MITATKAKRNPQPIKKESKKYFEALGKHISLLRKERGMTQAELARTLGVSQQAVFAYEIGERRVSVLILKKISRIFSTSLDGLAGMETPRPAPKNRRLSPKAMRHAERIQNLTKTAQRFLNESLIHWKKQDTSSNLPTMIRQRDAVDY